MHKRIVAASLLGTLIALSCSDAPPLYQPFPYDNRDAGAGTGGTSSAGATSAGAAGATGATAGTGGAGGAGGSGGSSASGGSSTGGSSASGGTAGVDQPFPTDVVPLVFAPTTEGFGINLVFNPADPPMLGARVRSEQASEFGEIIEPVVRANDVAEWKITGLGAGTRYVYEIVDVSEDPATLVYQGSAMTAREGAEPFSFALLSDSHIGAYLEFGNQGDEEVLRDVSLAMEQMNPDFVVNLGDMLDFHQYGFNSPPPDGSITRLAYLNYRKGLGHTTANAGHFPVIGNWEGENGEYTQEQIAWSREARMTYMPGPDPDTYPEGGSTSQDYYAFTWGNALFVVLNVMTYTPTAHLLRSTDRADDWTLGPEQLEFLRQTLENATTKWRFLLIHHAVGGAAGDPANSGYGRGGGQAANVGEQAIVHQLMIEHGVQIFFYGHDHVFTDMVVDDIHYTAPGSAGAIWMFTPAETGYEVSWLESGWGRVDVTEDNVHVTFLGMTGAVIHEYTID